MDKNQTQGVSKVTMANIIGSIRQTRDHLITALLHEPSLMCFLEEHCDIFAISPIKLEFLKRELKELQDSSLDLVHYSTVIKQMKEWNTYASEHSHPLLHQELRTIMLK